MSFPVNLLSENERAILSFMAKHRDSDVMRFEAMDGDGLQAHGEAGAENFEVNSPSFNRLVLSRLITNSTGDLYCITHDGIQCVLEFEK